MREKREMAGSRRDRDNEKVGEENERKEEKKEKRKEKSERITRLSRKGERRRRRESDKPSKGICRCWTSRRIVLPR